MVTSLVAHTLQHSLHSRPAALPAAPPDAPQGSASPSRTALGGSSIAQDLGQLTTDTLNLFGLGSTGSSTGGSKAAQAYASGNSLQ